MKKPPLALAALACAVALAFPAEAKKDKPANQNQQQNENADNGGIPRYQPFPHNYNFILTEINGKSPAKEIWLRIDATGVRALFAAIAALAVPHLLVTPWFAAPPITAGLRTA